MDPDKQVDLVDSSLIQCLLVCQHFWDARDRTLSEQQLFQDLQELFQRARVERPGQMDPRALKLTLSLLTAMYDSSNERITACFKKSGFLAVWSHLRCRLRAFEPGRFKRGSSCWRRTSCLHGHGFLKLASAAAVLIALSGDSPLTKYRALFQLYTENNRGHFEYEASMTRKSLRHLLTDLQQISTVVGESRAPCSVESATRSCFQEVLSPAIKEDKFLNWLQSEPLILLWLPTFYRLSVNEMVTHPVWCSICKNFPIIGRRYRCLKCLNFDICQVCFEFGLHSTPHQESHPVVEHCIQISVKENRKLLLRTLRNHLLQGRSRRKEAPKRQWLLDQVNPKGVANHTHSRLSTQYQSSKVPAYASPLRPVETAAKEAPKQIPQRISQAQQTDDSSSPHQTLVSLRNELWKTRECIDALHKERRFLKKQLNRCKDKLQAIYTSQEEKNCRFEAKIHQLTTNQDSLWTKLQQMEQDPQAVLQLPHPLTSFCQNMASKSDHSLAKRFWRRGDASQIKNITEEGSEWKPVPNPIMMGRSHPNQTNSEHGLLHPGPPEAILQLKAVQSSGAQSPAQKMLKETLLSAQEGWSRDTPQFVPAEMNSPALALAEREDKTTNIEERKDELEEEQLQELLSKYKDAFIPETPPGPKSSVSTNLYYGAEQVSRTFSALIDQITVPNLK